MITIIQNYSIGDILSSMRYLISSSLEKGNVRKLAVDATAGKGDILSAVYDWVKEHVTYTPDPILPNGSIELFTSPDRMARDYYEGHALAEDCDGISLLTTSMFLSLGIPARTVLLDTSGGGLDHAVTEAYSERLGSYLMIDPSSDLPPGWHESYNSRVEV